MSEPSGILIWEAELKRRLQALYAIALESMSEKEARALFCSITKRGRGKRGPARSSHPPPSKEAERKRRAREGPPVQIEIVRHLTEADIEGIDQHFIDRLNNVADKK
jgi:hypothetical protein